MLIGAIAARLSLPSVTQVNLTKIPPRHGSNGLASRVRQDTLVCSWHETAWHGGLTMSAVEDRTDMPVRVPDFRK